MHQLSPLDLTIVAVYILGMTALGAWFTRSQKDLRTYFVGGRNVGWFLVFVSIVATETSAVTYLSVPGVGFNRNGGNLTFLQLSFGYIIGRCLIAWFLLPQFMRGDLFSGYQVLQERFGPAVQRVASGLFLVTRTVADGLRIFLTALLLQYVGWGVEVSILAVGFVTIVYTYLGGMKAVIWTDLIQFVIKIAGALLAGVFVLKLLPGGWGQFLADGEAAGKFKLLETTFDPVVPYNLWAGLVGGAVFSMASHGADQLMVQRYLCARSLGHARFALVLSGFTVLAQFLLFLAVGIGMYLLNEAGEFPLPDGVRNDEVFGLFIVTKLPTGVVGLLVAAVLAAAMSTLSSSLNSSANAIVTDFYRPLRPLHSELWYVRLSRIMTVVCGIIQMAVAFTAYRSGGSKSVVEQVLAVAGFTTGLLLGLFILGSLRRPVQSSAALVGMLCGFTAVLVVWLFSVFGSQLLAWPWYAPLGCGTTVLVAFVTQSLMTITSDGKSTDAHLSS
ncbi:sodium:solute symporter family transporter [Fimbriiglobus ruber]|uniref:Transporter, solute:sodium symporter (SSS) family protein n=1 Tax=Fimbriiglobus ruber TaxID=1908690 RepID=A0A225D277_9BACT|nr:sodium/solute symporter [Fimbriiglobus ruber]OWK35043.1 transporter, solute:sodium symporter (SSS) family protein [Fimbriiglobus ruber]